MMGHSLYWDATYEIVLALMAAYPEIDLDNLGLDELGGLILSMPAFADDPDLVNDAILKEILRDWYEENGA